METPKLTDGNSLDIKGLTEVLVRHYGYKEGLWELVIEFRVGFGALGPTEAERLPSAVLGLSRIGLNPTNKANAFSVDAAAL